MNRQALDLYTRMWSNCGPHVRGGRSTYYCKTATATGVMDGNTPVNKYNIETLNPRNSKVVWPGDEIIELYII